MSSEYERDIDALKMHGESHQYATREAQQADPALAYPVALRSDGRLGTSHNNSLRASMMQNMQHTHGNRAVQRSIHRDIHPEPPVTVQRDIWDLFKGGSVGDWQIKPPTWSGETDDRYDHPENQRRAEQKEADERGYSPTPNEWWKPPQYDPKAPLPWLPKIREKEQEAPIIIPPKPPDERGDYPIPPWPDEEIPA